MLKGAGVYGITPSFPELFRTTGKVPTRYSPVCRSHCWALDLHVLGLPPAFVLSQDQTLKLKSVILDGLEEVTPRIHCVTGTFTAEANLPSLPKGCPSSSPGPPTSGDGLETQVSPEFIDLRTLETCIPRTSRSARTPPPAFPFLRSTFQRASHRRHAHSAPKSQRPKQRVLVRDTRQRTAM